MIIALCCVTTVFECLLCNTCVKIDKRYPYCRLLNCVNITFWGGLSIYPFDPNRKANIFVSLADDSKQMFTDTWYLLRI